MIATDADRLYSGCDALRVMYKILLSNMQIIADTRGQLSSIAGMETTCCTLQRLAHMVDMQADQCRRLSQSLDIICQTYVSCENRVLDRCENVLACYKQPVAKFVDLSSAAALLEELSFRIDGGDTTWQQEVLK